MPHCAARIFAVLAFALLVAPVCASASEEPVLGPHSGLPVPRFVALDADEANGRRRPDAGAPIDWIYVARRLPLRVVAESGPWRRVEDPEGGQVWMHAENLSGDRTVYVRGGRRGEAMLRAGPRADARTLAVLEAGVIAEVLECQADYVRLKVGDRTGWVRAEVLWGASSCNG
ncbi:MAG: hypothetical protein KGS44_00280 [Alphaproteobacteria bacterium]|nr:hypothetical protein [Alphaproteobacteria bacterium]